MGKVIKLNESDIKRIVKRVLNEQRTGEGLYRHILENYIGPIMDKHNMDDFGDPFSYYDNVIGWGIEKYLETEEPEREDDWDYRDELEEEIKDWWQPI